MSVSFEIRETLTEARAATPVMVVRPKSAMQARRSPLISMLACVDEGDVSPEVLHRYKKKIIPLSNPRGLCGGYAYTSSRSQRQPTEQTSAKLPLGRVITYKLSTVDVSIPLDEVVDVPIFHPLRDQSEPVFTHSHSKEWQDVGMSKVFPSNALSTESL